MNIQDLLKDITSLTGEQIEKRLYSLAQDNSHFRNLNEKNRHLVLNLIKEYRDLLKSGIHISSERVRRDNYELYEKRISLGLSPEDLADIKEILGAFVA
jgi:hypothetical protein